MGKHDPEALNYRPEIDGLRAVAVLSVIGFHAEPRIFPGGYVGVDIFFVISGFLITSIILRQLDRGTFSFLDFYARRCKRILPALIVVLAAVLAFGWMFLLPGEYEHLGRHTLAGAGFISNFVFWIESGYFDTAAGSKPLLHLWSLGVEEQFYLLWPPVLAWAWRRKSDAFNVTVGIVSVSFAINVILVSLWQAADMYFLLPIRVWELLLGGALAHVHIFRKQELENYLARCAAVLPTWRFITIENIQATTGLGLIMVAVAVLDKATLFPGWWGLLPTTGALLLISAGPKAWLNRRVLASRLLVSVGLISYPLYLWHWPLLSYVHIMSSGNSLSSIRWVAVGAAFLLSWLTYRWVEMWLRFKAHPVAIPLLMALTIVGAVGAAVFSGHLHARSESMGTNRILGAGTGDWGFPGPKLKAGRTPLGNYWERTTGTGRVLFVGDSHMEQYYARIDRLLTEHPNATKSVLFVTGHACLPIADLQGVPPKCEGLVRNGLSLAKQPGVDTVVMGAAWNRYGVFESKHSDAALQSLAATIKDFRGLGKQVYVVLPIPRGELFDPASLVKRTFRDFGFVIRKKIPRADAEATLKPVAQRIAEIAHSAGATILDPMDSVCQTGECRTLAPDGLPVYVDNSHLRPAYVREHVTFLDPIVSLPLD